jgi:hypothetical protein
MYFKMLPKDSKALPVLIFALIYQNLSVGLLRTMTMSESLGAEALVVLSCNSFHQQ